MLNHTTIIAATMASMTLVALASGESFTETFDKNSNEGGWSYLGTAPDGSGGPAFMNHQSSGGNPGAYIITPSGYATFAPTAQTKPDTDSVFVGNWAEMNVTSIGIDMKTFFVSFSAGGRPISLRLWNDNGTPYDFIDDWGFWFVGPDNMPLVGEGWKSYDFDVDAQANEAPDGWIPYRFDGSDPSDLEWGELMQDVDRVDFYHGEPDFFYILQDWQLGLDNARITYGDTVIGDIDGDGVVGTSDLLMLLAAWGACDGCPEDLTGDGMVGTEDLLELLANWG